MSNYPKLRECLPDACAIRPKLPVHTELVSKSTLNNWRRQGLVDYDPITGDSELTSEGAKALGYTPRFPAIVESMLNWINRPLSP